MGIFRGDGIEDVGQYDLEIIFRVKKDMVEKIDEKKLRYCIDWNLEINGKNISGPMIMENSQKILNMEKL